MLFRSVSQSRYGGVVELPPAPGEEPAEREEPIRGGEEGIGLHQTRKVEVESVFPTDFQVKEDGELVTIKEIVDGIDTEAVEQAEEDGLDVTFTGLYTESQVQEIMRKALERHGIALEEQD